MGGTDINEPLKAVMATEGDFFMDKMYKKNIFLLTDG